MKNIKTKIFVATIGITLIVLGCAASDYSDPSSVTKTGRAGDGTYYLLDFTNSGADRARVISSNTKTTTLGTCASSATATTTNALTVDSATAPTGLVSITGSNTCGTIQKTLLTKNKAYGSTAQNTTTTATITWTWGSSGATTQAVQYMRAFSSDIDGDGSSADAVAEGVRFTGNAGAGGITFIRSVSGLNAANTSGGTCVTAGTIAALGNAGQHTAVITISSAGSSGESTISVSVDGGTAVTSTSTTLGAGDTNIGTNAGLGDAAACAGGGADGPRSGFTKVNNSGAAANLATIFGVLNSTLVPVNDHQVTITNATTTGVPYTSDQKVILNKVEISAP